jgi:hypothetical protein
MSKKGCELYFLIGLASQSKSGQGQAGIVAVLLTDPVDNGIG